MAVSTPQAAASRSSTGASMLSPPQIRQPYTPPPRSQDEEYDDTEAQVQPLQYSNDRLDAFPVSDAHVVESVEDMAVCASPGEYAHLPRRKKKTTVAEEDANQTLAGMLRKGIVDHQIGLSLNLILLLAMSWCVFSSLRPWLDAFFLLSYKSVLEDSTIMYGQGPRDLYFVLALIVAFTGIRAFMLDYVLTPVAAMWGVRTPRMQARFAEQSYLLLYYLIHWNWGLYLFIRDTPALSTNGDASFSGQLTNLLISLWTGYPRLLVDAGMKLFYLSQLSFWVQQIAVVHLEERRKDHYQMLTHHFVTVALLSTSYGYRQLRVGNAVLVAMDIIEIIFPVSVVIPTRLRRLPSAFEQTDILLVGEAPEVPRLAGCL
jgi:very-long-chain ceramide synthase